MANTVHVRKCVISRMVNATCGFNDDGRPAWRISVQFPDDRATFAIPFARERDALMGARAIKSLMSFDGTFEEVRSRVADIGAKRIRQAVCEVQAW